MSKRCTGCGKVKGLNEFHKRKESEDGRQYVCKACSSFYHKIHHINNRELQNTKNRKWRIDNPEIAKQCCKKWYSRPNNKIHECLLSRTNECLDVFIERSMLWKVLGYTQKEFMTKIEEQLQNGMTWDNHGKEWEIDHIIPISFFVFQSPNDVEFKMCWRLENIQPMWKHEHRVKSNRILVA